VHTIADPAPVQGCLGPGRSRGERAPGRRRGPRVSRATHAPGRRLGAPV